MENRGTVTSLQRPASPAAAIDMTDSSDDAAASVPFQTGVEESGSEASMVSCWRMAVLLLALLHFVATVPLPVAQSIAVLDHDRAVVPFDGDWISAVSLVTNGIDAYLFDQEPLVSESLQLPLRTINPILRTNMFHAVRYDLYAGSEVFVNWSFENSKPGPSVLFLRGESTFNFFIIGELHNTPPEDRLFERYHVAQGQTTLRTTSREKYYFIFFMADEGSAEGTVNFNVTAKTISLTDPAPLYSSKDTCPGVGARQCTLPLVSNSSHNFFLVIAPPTTGEYGDLFSVVITKTAKAGKYAGAILRTCLFVAVFGGYLRALYEFVCSCARSVKHKLTSVDWFGRRGGFSEDAEAQHLVPQQGYPTEDPPAYSFSEEAALGIVELASGPKAVVSHGESESADVMAGPSSA
ncbi:hypothetical protein HDU84_008906 [Entophlyctis sp. JEL0112]|nr:hypothetical protein HDU84_008906 [Entophlyctis sp. JEL0112]